MPDPSTNMSPREKSSAGPLAGIVIILIVMLFGAFYFWGEHLNKQNTNPPPFIPGDASSTKTLSEDDVIDPSPAAPAAAAATQDSIATGSSTNPFTGE